MTEQEQWRPIPGFEGLYSVSDQGRVRRDAGGKGARAGRILTPSRNKPLYRHGQVALTKEGVNRRFLVHRLVALAFIGECPPGMEVAHKNGDASDNRVVNLEYKTHRENMLDVHRLNQKFGGQVLTLDQIPEIRRRLSAGETAKAIALSLGVSRLTISDIKHGRTWAHDIV